MLNYEIDLLRQYRQYIKSLKYVLIFIKDKYLNKIIKQVDNNYFRGNNYCIEVDDVIEIYNYYNDKAPIIFVKNEKMLHDINKYIEMNTIFNNVLPMDASDYHLALLIEVNKISYPFNETNEYVPHNYELSENVYYEDNHNFFFCGKSKKNMVSTKIALLPGNYGYGDIIIVLPAIQYYIDNSIYSFEILHTKKRTYEICSRYLKRCKNILLSPNTMYGVYKKSYGIQSEYRDLHILSSYENSVKNKSRCHYIEYLCSKLRINPNIDDIIRDFTIDDTSICDEHKHLLYKIRKAGKYIVTTQFYTSNDPKRCLTKEFALEFVRLCQINDICVIQLEPNNYNIEGVIDLSNYSILDICRIIKHVNIHVGIDSCFGHISALQGTPSLTIWIGANPLSSESGRLCSFRPLRKNYSIFVEKRDELTKISPKLVFEKLLDILNEKIALQDRFLSFQDSMSNVDCYVIK